MVISILIADEHPVVRRGIKNLLETESDFRVVGECGDGLQAVQLATKLNPDVLILDLMLPSLSGLDAVRIVRERAPETRIVVLSISSATEFIAEALKNGASGYLLKGCTEENIVRGIREVAAGQRFLSPMVSESAVEANLRQLENGPIDPHETLTPREREILHLSAEGNSNPQIAARLHLSPRTVENHRANLLRKLGLGNQSELVMHAVRHGLIAVAQPTLKK